MIDFDAIWCSDKLAKCDKKVRGIFTWVFGIADCNGSFELNMRSIWGRVSAIRPDLSMARLEYAFAEFERNGLLFTWTFDGKRFGHWVGSEKPGRLPPRSERHRYKKFAPGVPAKEFNDYLSRFTSRPDSRAESRTGVGFGVGLGLDRKGVGVGEVSSSNIEGNDGHGNENSESLPVSEKQNQKQNQKSTCCPRCGARFTDAETFSDHLLAHRNEMRQ